MPAKMARIPKTQVHGGQKRRVKNGHHYRRHNKRSTGSCTYAYLIKSQFRITSLTSIRITSRPSGAVYIYIYKPMYIR